MTSVLGRRWRQALAGSSVRVALADGDDARAVEAASTLASEGLVTPVLVASTPPAGSGVSGVEVVAGDEGALLTAMNLVAEGHVAGCVAGATMTTADVVRAAIGQVGLASGVELVSGCMLLDLADGRVVAFADASVVPEPDEDKLATIAIATARTFVELVDEEARVAMLSYSTLGSASGSSVDKVRAATQLVRERAPGLAVDGELQFDAAFVPEVALLKAPGSAVAGNANVFVFQSLDAANSAYKVAERIGGARAMGPLLQGLAAPVHDLSRGCSADDIVEIATIAAVQALSRHVR